MLSKGGTLLNYLAKLDLLIGLILGGFFMVGLRREVLVQKVEKKPAKCSYIFACPDI